MHRLSVVVGLLWIVVVLPLEGEVVGTSLLSRDWLDEHLLPPFPLLPYGIVVNGCVKYSSFVCCCCCCCCCSSAVPYIYVHSLVLLWLSFRLLSKFSYHCISCLCSLDDCHFLPMHNLVYIYSLVDCRVLFLLSIRMYMLNDCRFLSMHNRIYLLTCWLCEMCHRCM
jgi:hypothetical protein